MWALKDISWRSSSFSKWGVRRSSFERRIFFEKFESIFFIILPRWKPFGVDVDGRPVRRKDQDNVCVGTAHPQGGSARNGAALKTLQKQPAQSQIETA